MRGLRVTSYKSRGTFLNKMKVGVIADTHGLLRPQALDALHGVALIIHAGDIGDRSILEALEAIAPVHAVRGNNDTGCWARELPEARVVEAGGRKLYVLHDRKALRLRPAPADCAAIIAGHSHKPLVDLRDGVLHLNPGSAGPRRFTLPVTVARLVIGDRLEAEIVELQ